MADQDQIKWNEKYKEKIAQGITPAANPLLTQLTSSLPGGTCLELACGLGGNSLVLANHGYRVRAFDISNVAVDFVNQLAHEQSLQLTAEVVDLDQLTLPEEAYDLVIMTYFLDRRLFPEIKKAIKKGGWVFMETFYQASSDSNSHIRPEFKLLPQELSTLFSTWNISFHQENEQTGTASILAQKK